jgi:hypothetical protein
VLADRLPGSLGRAVAIGFQPSRMSPAILQHSRPTAEVATVGRDFAKTHMCRMRFSVAPGVGCSPLHPAANRAALQSLSPEKYHNARKNTWAYIRRETKTDDRAEKSPRFIPHRPPADLNRDFSLCPDVRSPRLSL